MIYLDHAATVSLCPEALEAMLPFLTEQYGNPSALYESGRRARQALAGARQSLAETLGCLPEELYFTSGGTEANNWALLAVAEAARERGDKPFLIATEIEHHAVLETLRYGKQAGLLDYALLPVSREGRTDLTAAEALLEKRPALVSCMGANNETGTLQPLRELLALCRERNIPLHSDLVQVYGQLPLGELLGEELPDFFSVSAHKFGGPKGVGFLYKNRRVSLKPVSFGGGQQGGLRSGTLNAPGIAGMGEAAREAYSDFPAKRERLLAIKNRILAAALEIPGVSANSAPGMDSAPQIISLSVEGVRAEVLLHALEAEGIFVSSGSACASNHPGISATLRGIGLPKQLLDATIRLSFSAENTEAEAERFSEVFRRLVPELRKFRR